MKQYIIDQLAKQPLTIAFTNGKSHTFSKVTQLLDNDQIIELQIENSRYSVLVNLENVAYISVKN